MGAFVSSKWDEVWVVRPTLEEQNRHEESGVSDYCKWIDPICLHRLGITRADVGGPVIANQKSAISLRGSSHENERLRALPALTHLAGNARPSISLNCHITTATEHLSKTATTTTTTTTTWIFFPIKPISHSIRSNILSNDLAESNNYPNYLRLQMEYWTTEPNHLRGETIWKTTQVREKAGYPRQWPSPLT